MDFQRIGKYEVERKIGEGAMGQVWKAHDPILNRDVAIKTMLASVGSDEDLRKRFHREAQSAARLNHPNIITVYDFGEEEIGEGRKCAYMAMELLDGSDLRSIIGNPSVTLDEKAGLMEQMCDGLTFAHSMEVVHRDLKPANIHVQPNGQVKIMDFGLARLGASDMTRTGMVMGTPNYMSPEQVRGEKVDARSDIFSIGAVFYELLTGHKPFVAESTHAVLFQVLEKDPEPLRVWVPALPQALADLVEKALRKDPADRFSDAGEMLDAVQEARRTIPPEIAMMALPPSDETAVTLAGQPRPTDPSSGARMGASGAKRSRWSARGSGGATASDPRSRSVRAPALQPATLQGRAPTRVETPGTVLTPAVPAPRRAGGGRGPAPYAVAAAVLLAGGGALGWYVTHRSPPPFAVAMEVAQRSLDAKDYKGALEQAEQALRLDPSSAEARRLIEQVRALAAHDVATPRPLAEPTVAPPVPSPETKPAPPNPAPKAPPRFGPSPTAAPATLPSPPPPTFAPTTTLPPPVTVPATVPVTAPPATTPPTTVAPAPAVNEDLAVRKVVEDYGRAIEGRDLQLFKKVKPNLTADDERKLREAFQGAGSQTVRITIGDVQVAGSQATVRLSRQDTIDGQTHTFQQTLQLTKGPSGWTIREIGR